MFKKIRDLVQLIIQNGRDAQNIGATQQVWEMAKLRVFHGIGPNYYLLAGFCAKDIPWELKASHKSAAAYKAWIDAKNPKLYRKISQNKLAESAMLHFMHIPATRHLGFLHPDIGVDVNGRDLKTVGELAQMLISAHETAVVFKPLEGHGGYGIRVFDVAVSDAGVTLADRISREEFELAESNDGANQLLENADGWIIEAYFVQHPVVAAINPTSVNTIRMWVGNDKETNVPRCIAGYLRIGRDGAVVDNQSSGGIVCPIDMQTGVLKITQSGTPERRLYTHHPDHGAAIEGVSLPHWAACQRLAEHALHAFPHMNFCGLDIAIGEDGPVIVELNPSPDKEGAAFMQIPFPD